MKHIFRVESPEGDTYEISLSSGVDAFFATQDVCKELSNEFEIVEIDLERLSGDNPTSPHTLSLITEQIGRFFLQNNKAILYYYCDDLAEVPKSNRKQDMWPQEYRSQLFSIMLQRYVVSHSVYDLIDENIMLDQGGSPIYMHLIGRAEHANYIQLVKQYILTNYGK